MVFIEKSFPRGGDTKVIRAAKRENDDNDKFGFGVKCVRPAKKKKVSGPKKENREDEPPGGGDQPSDDTFEFKSAKLLSRKTIQEHMLVIGMVAKVESTCVHMSLPGKLKGVVPVTSISDSLTQRLEAAVKNSKLVPPTLEELFRCGDLFYCKVMRLPGEGERVVELSLNPKHVNSEFHHGKLNEGMIVCGAVASWEDHGVIVDIGIANARCFWRQAKGEAKRADIGQLKMFRLEKVIKSTATANVTLAALESGQSREVIIDNVQQLDYVVPTAQVIFTIFNKLKNGLSGKVLDGFFTGYLNIQHLGRGKSLDHFDIGQDILATVMYVEPLTKCVYLTLNDYYPEKGRLADGTIITNAKILSVNTGGVHLKLNKDNNGLMIFGKHRSDIKSTADLQKKYGDTLKRVRVIEYEPMDGIYMCTDDPKLLNEKYFSLSDVQVGQTVPCEVVNEVKGTGVLIKIGLLTGFLYNQHLTKSVQLKAGCKFKARVLYIDQVRRSVHVTTIKEFLAASGEQLLLSHEEAKKGKEYLGMVKTATAHLVYVEFFNHVSGAIKLADTTQVSSSLLKPGKVIKVQVTEVTGNKIQLKLPGKKKTPIPINEFVSGTVGTVENNGLELIRPNGDSLWIGAEFLSQFSELCPIIVNSYSRGDPITALCLDENLYSVRDVDSYRRNAMFKAKQLKIGTILRAHTTRIDSDGIMVRIPLRDGAHCTKVAFSDVLINAKVKNPKKIFSIGQVVYVRLTNVTVSPKKSDKQQWTFSAKLDAVWSGNIFVTVNHLKDYFKDLNQIHDTMFEKEMLEELKVGRRVEAKIVKEIVKGQRYEVRFKDGQLQGTLRTEKELKNGADIDCCIVWIDETGALTLSDNPKLLARPSEDDMPPVKYNKAKISSTIVHETLHCYVAVLHDTGHLIYVPNRFHFNDFQPVLQNRTGDCKVVVLHTEGDQKVAVIAEVYDKTTRMDLTASTSGRKRNLSVGSEDSGTVAIIKSIGDDVVPSTEEPPRKKAAKVHDDDDVTPIALDESGKKLDQFWNLDFSQIGQDTNKPDDENEDNAEDDGPTKKRLIHEKEVRSMEEALVKSNQPTSVEEFDRMILATPNNSLLWIKYMVFHLQISEVEKARNTFRRAVKSIGFRFPNDLLNVWMAFLNLELRYGTTETFDQAFDEALTTNDQFKITMRTIEILADAKRMPMLDAKANVAVKRFRDRTDMWTGLAKAYFSVGLDDKANLYLNRALGFLPKRDRKFDYIDSLA